MAIAIEVYMAHLGNVLDQLAQERSFDPDTLSIIQSSPPPLVQKVDSALQRLIQKMHLMQQELAHHRRECRTAGASYPGQPSSLVALDLPQTPPILTPPVDPLSPAILATTRWNEDFMHNAVTYPSPYSCPPQQSLQTLSDAVASSTNSNSTSISLCATGAPMMHSSSPASSTRRKDQKRSLDPSTTTTSTASATISPNTAHESSSGFLAMERTSSVQSSPDSFVSVQSTFPIDNSDVEPATITVSTIFNRSTAPSVLENAPCAACAYNCALVAYSVIQGDLGVRIECENPTCANSTLVVSINKMVAMLAEFTTEVIEVAAQGVEGKLGVQASSAHNGGIWKKFVNHLNTMTVGHSEQVRDIASVCTAVAHGDLSKQITVAVKGETLVLKNTINTMVQQLRNFSSEVTRVAHEVGTEGKLGGQAHVKGVDGTWKELTDNVNIMAANLTTQVRDIASVSKAVARGDLSKKISVAAKGEMMDLKHTINTMVDQLQEFATEVSRVSLEVGTEGKLGSQAVVKDVSGTWKELTDNVNLMASNLTGQVRDIAVVCKAVASGDMTKKVSVPVQGEVLELKETMNTMVDQLRMFATEVTRVAREVGTEGKLGGQAEVEGVDGTWKELTDNVNTMAANLTTQVRSIAQVTTAVACGDLSKTIDVQAQ
ncbi:hypothetical protein BGZ50_008790, partial [Haplosporangium sp. Z 11]